ncbi:MAG: Gfo/Idh/MocA family oxidoreductase, partial [Chloroflexi bacterium]|nr:Gfo/Idh/MocA family oxidoreductase [Chloroflexota bacterium]
AAADLNPDVRARFHERYPEARVYTTAEDLLKDPDVEAVWISTPNKYHGPMAIQAAEAGKHVVVEKPMALDMKQAEAMVEAAHKNSVVLVAGHTQSFSPHFRLMRQIVRSGELGALGAINVFSYTDWVIRPRTEEELDPNQGGGLVYRQVPHQVDTVRLIGGGKIKSVRGSYGQWMPERSIPGYYSAFMEFENGVPAVVIHNGYGYLMISEFAHWGTSDGPQFTAEQRKEIRSKMRSGTREEDAEKLSLRIGGERERQLFRRPGGVAGTGVIGPYDAGIAIVSCERGEIRQAPYGVYVYTDEGRKEIVLPKNTASRDQELVELYNAAVLGKPVFHSGEWGMATIEVVMAINESTKTHKSIELSHQIEMPAEYDVEYKVTPESEKLETDY